MLFACVAASTASSMICCACCFSRSSVVGLSSPSFWGRDTLPVLPSTVSRCDSARRTPLSSSLWAIVTAWARASTGSAPAPARIDTASASVATFLSTPTASSPTWSGQCSSSGWTPLLWISSSTRAHCRPALRRSSAAVAHNWGFAPRNSANVTNEPKPAPCRRQQSHRYRTPRLCAPPSRATSLIGKCRDWAADAHYSRTVCHMPVTECPQNWATALRPRWRPAR